MEQQAVSKSSAVAPGSRDGIGAGDHDLPFHFGSRPTSAWTYPFTSMQYARLLVMRGRAVDGDFAEDMTRA